MPTLSFRSVSASETSESLQVAQRGLLPWLVVFSAALYFFFEFMQVNMFNALTTSLFQTFHIDSVRLSKIWFCYSLANVIFLIPAGIILDHVSTRRLIITAMLVSVVCTYGISRATAVWQIEWLRFITGVAGAFCLLSAVRLAARWFPPRKMALVVGLIVTFAMTGGMLAQTPFTMMVAKFGWRETVALDAFVGAGMLVFIVLFVRDFPPGVDPKADAHAAQSGGKHFWGSLFSVLKTLQNWLGGIYTSLMNLPIFILGALWGSLYLTEVRHLTPAQASYVTSMIFVGTMIGSPVIGWFSDYMRSRRMPMIWGAVLSIVALLWLMYAPHLGLGMLMFLFFTIGFLTSSQIISYALIAESNPRHLTGSAEGIAATLIMAGGFMTTVFAWLMNSHWDHRVLNHVPIYAASDFRWGMLIMPIGFVLALAAAWLTKETRCRSLEARRGDKA